MTAGLTYWRCPECGTRVDVPYVGTDQDPDVWDFIPITAARCERMVEAHEAKHLGGGA